MLPEIGPEPAGDGTPFSQLTTMRVGGPAERVLVAHELQELVAFAQGLWDTDEPWLLLGGGSNTVMHDDGFPGTVLLVRTTGIAPVEDDALPEGKIRLRVQAGHDWDHLVAACVENGWSGIEALSGIPGAAGAAPVQNIGAYGQELSDVLHSIEFLDRDRGYARRIPAADLGLAYRDSAIKQGLEGVVLSIDIVLTVGEVGPGRRAHAAPEVLSEPIAYAQLAGALGVEVGDRVPIRDLRDSVLGLRASKGMVLDPDDHDSWSSGSFFTNPIVTERFAHELPENAPRFPQPVPEVADAVTTFEELEAGYPIRVPQATPERMVKLSAAWLIEHAGVQRGFRLPGSGAAISSKHTLAITNRGGATAHDVAELARFVVQRVQQEFGVILAPEPNLYGLEL
ncbi:UDP-N-acetylmuramate dehydrogenase [Leucobacter musarum]|uniref:UDP-N-acetylmuramate dehydrogenase n=1 Tax=Leucobacter musarum TaxID=1930747 RepID=UPI0009499BAC|nr:UDP-N-acetylmuramate dehydrogenase [Leucobacter musarum]